MLGKLMNTYHVYTARMSPALSGSSALERFKRINVIEIRNGIMLDFYPGLPQLQLVCLDEYSVSIYFQMVSLSTCWSPPPIVGPIVYPTAFANCMKACTEETSDILCMLRTLYYTFFIRFMVDKFYHTSNSHECNGEALQLHVVYRRLGIFTLKIILVRNFRVVKFVQSAKFFLTVDDHNMDKRLESSWHLVYYQVSGEPGIAGCSRRSDIYLGECGLARKLIH